MSDTIKVHAEKRETTGTGAARRLRNKGVLPAIVYGLGKEPQSIQLNQHEFQQLLRHHTSEYLMMDLEIGSSAVLKVLLKDVQHDPISGDVQHVDFNEISMTEKIVVEVPVETRGTPEGVTQQGGVLDQQLRSIEIECLPTDIPEVFHVDVSALEIGEHMTVGDIELDASKYTLVTDPLIALAAVSAPRLKDEGDEGEEGATASAEPALVRGKPENENKDE